MGFRMIPASRVKKTKSKNSQEVLDRLEKYLKEHSDEPVRVLCGFWEDQQDAISYQEIRQALLDGYISEQTIRDWQHDYSVLVKNEMVPLWQNTMAQGYTGQPIFDGKNFSFNTQTPGALRWINERGADFVTASSEEQKQAIAALLEKKMRDGHTVDELAKLIRPCIGLTTGQARATTRLYDSIIETMTKQHPRMDPARIRKTALSSAMKYAERAHRQRALTIAQTELAFAYNRGADEGVRQAMQSGMLGLCKKVWSTSGDYNVCQECNALEGTVIGMDDSFGFGGRELFTGHKMLPPAHPLCACAVEYIEVEPPKEMESYVTDSGSNDEFMDGVVDRLRIWYDELTGKIPAESLSSISGVYEDEVKRLASLAKGDHGKLLKALADDIKFVKTEAMGHNRCSDRGIFINLAKDSRSIRGAYTGTFHEIGHSVDRILGNISEQGKFGKLLRSDAKQYVKDVMAYYGKDREQVLDLLEGIMKNSNPDSVHVVSDLLSGVFPGERKWRFHHDPEYWQDSKALEREAFAHFFSAGSLGNADKIDNITVVFPNAYKEYLRMIKEAARNV